MKKQLFLSLELSLLLKKKGFKENCFSSYVQMSKTKFKLITERQLMELDAEIGIGNNLITPAPLYQQVVDWFRRNYKINIQVAKCEYVVKSCNGWYFTLDNPTKKQHWDGKSTSYYGAFDKGIKAALKQISQIK